MIVEIGRFEEMKRDASFISVSILLREFICGYCKCEVYTFSDRCPCCSASLGDGFILVGLMDRQKIFVNYMDVSPIL